MAAPILAASRIPMAAMVTLEGTETVSLPAASRAHPARKSAAPGMMSCRKRRAASSLRARAGDGFGRTVARAAVRVRESHPRRRTRSKLGSMAPGTVSSPSVTMKFPKAKRSAVTMRPSTTGPARVVSLQKTRRATKRSDAATEICAMRMATTWGTSSHPLARGSSRTRRRTTAEAPRRRRRPSRAISAADRPSWAGRRARMAPSA